MLASLENKLDNYVCEESELGYSLSTRNLDSGWRKRQAQCALMPLRGRSAANRLSLWSSIKCEMELLSHKVTYLF